MGQVPARVFAFEEALTIVERQARALGRVPLVDSVALLETRGRVLGEPVLADRDQPGFDRATRDGFAVRAVDLAAGTATVIGQVRAGQSWPQPVASGQAVQIMTGAPVPEGADAVVMIEHVLIQDGRIEDGRVEQTRLRLAAGHTLAVGDNIVPRAGEAHAGAELLPAGTEMGAAEIALAAACGYGELPVFRRPSVALVATGDELVEVGERLGPEQIRNSNSYGLAALVAASGGNAVRLPIASDTRKDLRDRIAKGRQHDLLILSGGVSMGDYDLVEEILAEFDAEFFFTGVGMQPGKPVVFGRLPARGAAEPACLFFGLPGNPISTQVTFHCFVDPLLRVSAGQPWSGPRWALARLSRPVEGKPNLTRLLPGRMNGTEVQVLGWQGSGDMAANARANCYVEVTQDRAAGEIVRVLLREGR